MDDIIIDTNYPGQRQKSDFLLPKRYTELIEGWKLWRSELKIERHVSLFYHGLDSVSGIIQMFGKNWPLTYIYITPTIVYSCFV